MAVDVAGLLPVTENGNCFIVVAMDHFRKWPEAYAIPNHDAMYVADALVNNFFTRFGVPFKLHSDQGQEFEWEVFAECCCVLGIQKMRTTPLHTKSDGMVKRFKAMLAQELAKYCSEGQAEWDRKLPVFPMAYRPAEHQATGFTPAKLMLDHKLCLLVDLTNGRLPDKGLPRVSTEYAVTLQEWLEEDH